MTNPISRVRDIDLSFEKDLFDGDLKIVTSSRAVAESIVRIAMSNEFDVPYEPGCSGDLLKHLFQSNSSKFLAASVRSRLMKAVETYEPTAVIEKLEVIIERRTLKIDLSVRASPSDYLYNKVFIFSS